MARLEAALFVADSALSARRLVQCATLADAREVRDLIAQLNQAYDAAGSAFRVEQVASGYRLMTRPEFAAWLNKIHHRSSQLKLSSPALETLTIVAYRQPITRADIEAVRGVQSAEMLKYLMERGLVRIAGEDDSLGRPYLYGTTRQFLEIFGLSRLDDLPLAEQLRPRPENTNDGEDTGESADEDEEEADDEFAQTEDEDTELWDDEEVEVDDEDVDADEEADEDDQEDSEEDDSEEDDSEEVDYEHEDYEHEASADEEYDEEDFDEVEYDEDEDFDEENEEEDEDEFDDSLTDEEDETDDEAAA